MGGSQPLPRHCGDVPQDALSKLAAQSQEGTGTHTEIRTTHKIQKEPKFWPASATSQSSSKTRNLPASMTSCYASLGPPRSSHSFLLGASLWSPEWSTFSSQTDPFLACKHVRACSYRKIPHSTPPATAVLLSFPITANSPERALCLLVLTSLPFLIAPSTANQVSINSL